MLVKGIAFKKNCKDLPKFFEKFSMCSFSLLLHSISPESLFFLDEAFKIYPLLIFVNEHFPPQFSIDLQSLFQNIFFLLIWVESTLVEGLRVWKNFLVYCASTFQN